MAIDAVEYRRLWRTKPGNMKRQAEWNQKSSAKRYAWGAALIAAIKLAAGCADCGYNEWPESLQFDHLSDKKTLVSRMNRQSEEKIWAEVAKCEVVCANCHARRTTLRQIGAI